jgi:hypothetical protein
MIGIGGVADADMSERIEDALVGENPVTESDIHPDLFCY